MPDSIVIIGAGPLIGQSVAERFGAEGWRVVATARRPAAGRCGGHPNLLALPLDVTDEAQALREGLHTPFASSPRRPTGPKQSSPAPPSSPLPRAGLAYVNLTRVTWRMAADPAATMARAIADGRQAVEMDATSPFAQVVLGRLLTYAGELRLAFDHLRLARDLNPSYAATYYGLATAHLWVNEPEAALSNAEQALRFSPRDPLASMFITVQAFSRLVLGAPEDTARLARRTVEMQPREIWSRLALACALVEADDLEAARAVIAETSQILPDASFSGIRPISSNVAPVVRERVLTALGHAGMQ